MAGPPPLPSKAGKAGPPPLPKPGPRPPPLPKPKERIEEVIEDEPLEEQIDLGMLDFTPEQVDEFKEASQTSPE